MGDWKRYESRPQVGFDCADCSFITTNEWELDDHLSQTGHERQGEFLKSNRHLLIRSGIALLLVISLGGGLYGLLVGGGGAEALDAEQHYNAGVEFLMKARLNEAIAEYNEAIRLDPQNVDAYNDRALAYYALGESRRAVEDLHEVIRLDPQVRGVHSDRGQADDFLVLDESDRAIVDYGAAIRLDPWFAEAYVERCKAYFDMREYHRAVVDCDQAIFLGPQLTDAYANRASSHTALGNDSAAQQDIGRALELGADPSYLRNLLERAKDDR